MKRKSLELVQGRTELLSEPEATRGREPPQRQVRATLPSAWMRGKRGEEEGVRGAVHPQPILLAPSERGLQSAGWAALGANSGQAKRPDR